MRLTVERLRELLSYDPETGVFRWRRPGRGQKEIVGCKDRYLRIRIDQTLYYAHRLAWLYVYGSWPALVDHINGDKTDNRLNNLRLSTSSLNQFNRRVPPSGVEWIGQLGKWRVRIGARSLRRYIGLFKTKEEAVAARQRAVEEEFNG